MTTPPAGATPSADPSEDRPMTQLHTPPPAFTATCGADLVDWADRLDDLLAALDRTFDAGLGEDVAFWEDNRLVAVWLSDGRRLDLRAAADTPRPAA
jgi:hypothetical protein